MTSWMGGQIMRKSRNFLRESQLPSYFTPERAIQAYMTLVHYSKNLEMLFETPKEVPVSFSYDRDAHRRKYINEVFPKNKVLSEND